MAPPDDHQPPRPTRQRPAAPGPAEHPSGRWDLERFDPEVTPPPVDLESTAVAWHRSRERITNLEVLFAGLKPEIESISRRVGGLESKDAEMSRALVALEKSNALQTQSLMTIERGITEIKAVRSDDGTRLRFVLQIVTSVVAALAAITVSIVSLATR